MRAPATPPPDGPHQTRIAPHGPREKALGDALEAILGTGTHDLDGIVRGLNERNIPGPGEKPWTEESFRAEMARLGQ